MARNAIAGYERFVFNRYIRPEEKLVVRTDQGRAALGCMTKRHTSTTELARDFGLAAGHALWYRWPMLAAPRNIRGAAHDAEFGRMVAEKGAATVEGLFEAQKVILKLAGAAMMGEINPATIPR